MPVCRAIRCFTCEIPQARFSEKLRPGIVFELIADTLQAHGIASIRFDFNGHEYLKYYNFSLRDGVVYKLFLIFAKLTL